MSKRDDIQDFVLVLSGVSEPDSQLEDALFEAGCDDAILAFRNGVAYLEFDRQAPSLDAAVLSAIRDAEYADSRLTVVSVEPGDAVNASEVARRARVTREYIRLLIHGKRGEGGFPAPQSGITGKTLVWSWAKVVRWMLEHELLEDRTVVEAADIIRDINDALDVRQHPATMDRRLKYLRELQKSRNKVGVRS